MDTIRILLVDDHALFRRGLAGLLEKEKGFAVVGEAGDGAEAIRKAEALRPDLILMDVHMPGIDGLQATRHLTGALPATRVVMLTVSEEDKDLFEAIKGGRGPRGAPVSGGARHGNDDSPNAARKHALRSRVLAIEIAGPVPDGTTFVAAVALRPYPAEPVLSEWLTITRRRAETFIWGLDATTLPAGFPVITVLDQNFEVVLSGQP